MIFPDTFERILAKPMKGDRASLFATRATGLNGLDPLQLDRELRTIRQRLERGKRDERPYFYVLALRAEWKTETFAAATEDVTEAHVRSALEEIDREGIPDGAHSTTYDLTAGGNRYPPKLVCRSLSSTRPANRSTEKLRRRRKVPGVPTFAPFGLHDRAEAQGQ